jgi:nucleotide-binding universal stress UspA family protein/anti-anti-sigma regulatory factor
MIIHVRGDVIELSGLLQENYWPALKSAVSLQLKQHPNGIVIDGSELTEINEVGAQTFLEASDYIESQRARVVFSGLSEHIQAEIRHIPGARSQLPLAATVEEARASLSVGGAQAAVETRRRPAVLVPLVGDWASAIEYAVPQAAERRAEIHLLYILQVPRAMPLGVPLPDKEREAREALSNAEQRLKRSGITARKLSTRSRTAIDGVERFAEENRPELILAAYSKAELERDSGVLHAALTTLCHKTPSGMAVFCTGERSARSKGETCQPGVLVPLTGAWPEAVRFAAVEAAAGRTAVDMLYVLQVPRTMALDAPFPDREREAQESLANAEQTARRHGLTVRRHIVRSRSLFEGIAKFASDTKPRLAVLSYFREDMTDEDSRYVGISTLCQDSPCDIAVVCFAHATAEQAPR